MELLWYVGIDHGATHTRGRLIDPRTGKLIKKLFDIKNEDVKNNLDLLQKVGNPLIGLAPPGMVKIGVCAAGVVDEIGLKIVFSANLKNIRGEVTFPWELKREGYDVSLTNDMRGATLGEYRFGQGKNVRDIAVATYSSGYNFSVCSDGLLTGRVIEAGHQAYKPGSGVLCGCGGKDHLEVSVSGEGAKREAWKALSGATYHTILEEVVKDEDPEEVKKDFERLKSDPDYRTHMRQKIIAKHVYAAWRRKPNEGPQKDILDMQAEAIAHSFGQMVSTHSPLNMIICMGSQTNDWDPLFTTAIQMYKSAPVNYHHPNLQSPEIVKSEDPDIGAKGSIVDFMQKYDITLSA